MIQQVLTSPVYPATRSISREITSVKLCNPQFFVSEWIMNEFQIYFSKFLKYLINLNQKNVDEKKVYIFKCTLCCARFIYVLTWSFASFGNNPAASWSGTSMLVSFLLFSFIIWINIYHILLSGRNRVQNFFQLFSEKKNWHNILNTTIRRNLTPPNARENDRDMDPGPD